MLKKLALIFLLSVFLFNPLYALAQSGNDGTEAVEESKIQPVIGSEDFIGVGKKVLFDASESVLLDPDKPAVYIWNFGDGYTDAGKEVVHQYARTGAYTVNLRVRQGENVGEVVKDVFVYDRNALLITDHDKEEELSLIREQAAENGVALQILSVVLEEGGFVAEDRLVEEIKENGNYISNSHILIFYSKSAIGLQTFSRYFQSLRSEQKKLISQKFFTVLTDGSLDVAGNLAFQAFDIIEPEHILLSRPEALGALFTVKDYEEVVGVLQSRGVEYEIINEERGKSVVFVLSSLISLFLAKGATSSSIYLLLAVPFLAFVVVFFRQVVGLTTFGVYTPVMIAASFFILGIWLGILTFLFAVLTSYIVKYVVNKFELLYVPKVGLNLSFISLSFLFVVLLILLLDISVPLSLAIFPMLVMSNVAEKFMAAQSEEGFRGAMMAVAETLIVVVVAYYLIIWTSFSNLVMSWPELVLTPILLTLLLGKFSGLRLNEYLRFRSLFSDHTEE